MSELPPGWAEAPVSQLLENSIGGVWGKEAGTDEVDAMVIRVADFRDDGSINFGSAPLRSVTTRQLMSRELRVGDILLEKSGGGPTKSVGRVVRMRPASGPVVPTNFVQLLRPDDELVDSAFLFWWLWRSHSDGTASVFQRATTNIRNLRTQDYLDRRAPLPPLNEQRRIVAAIEEQLSRLDAADASLAQATRRLEAMRRSVLSASFAPIQELRQLRELAQTQLGKMLSAKSRTGVGARPYLRNKNVQWGRIDVDHVLQMDFSERDVEKFELRPGDVLVCEGGEVGRAAVWRGQIEGCCYQKALHRVRVKDGLSPEYLVHALRWMSDRDAFDPYVTGSTIKHLPQEDLRVLPIPSPPLEEQRRIVAEVEERLSVIEAMRASIERAQRRSGSLRRSILERAFRGELVPQDPSDEPASVLLDRIRAERAATASPGRGRVENRPDDERAAYRSSERL